MTLLFQKFYELVASLFSCNVLFSGIQLGRLLYQIALHIITCIDYNAVRLNSYFILFTLVTWHLYHITLMMMLPLEHVVTCRTMSNVRKKSGHVICTLFDNVAIINAHLSKCTYICINVRICYYINRKKLCELKSFL